MITYTQLNISDVSMSGFQATQPEPMTLAIEGGTLQIGETLYNYEGFDLEAIADPTFPVVYDVYLLVEAESTGFNIHVDRTELVGDAMAFYEGEIEQIHCLLSFLVPPATTDLSGVDINVRLMVQEGDSSEQENSSE